MMWAYQGLLVCWWCVSVFARVCQRVSVSCGVREEMSDLCHIIRWMCVNCTSVSVLWH